MRSLTVVGILVGLAIVVGMPYFLGHMNLSSPYSDTTSVHKGNEDWPIIPVGLAIIIAGVSTFALSAKKKYNQKTDKVMFGQNEMTEYKPLAHREKN